MPEVVAKPPYSGAFATGFVALKKIFLYTYNDLNQNFKIQRLCTRIMGEDIKAYNNRQPSEDKAICEMLAKAIDDELAEAERKIWHAHPVWFLEGNPIVGYSKQKAGWRLMFWSGADFDEDSLGIRGKKFKDASIFFTSVEQINKKDLVRWLKKSRDIQWDYKSIVKRKGQLERLK